MVGRRLDARCCAGGTEPGFSVPVAATGTTPIRALLVEHTEALSAAEGLVLDLGGCEFNGGGAEPAGPVLS